MAIETLELTVFHCVAKHASYARAAEELRLSPSGVSRIITRLEEGLGVRLVQRSTRKVALTEAGMTLYQRAQQLLIDLSDAEAEVQKTALRPRGTLRISAPVVFGQRYLAPAIVELTQTYPELSVDLSLIDRFVDLIEEGVDLAIRIGSLSASGLTARRLCTNRRIVVASPEYLARRGVPCTPQELERHEVVVFSGFARPREWRLVQGSQSESVAISGRLATNNVEVLTLAAKRGLGVTFGATMSAGPALVSGELVRVLPDWELEPTAVFAVYPSGRQLSSKVRATIDFLAEALKDPPVWDRELAGKVPGF
jgi:DNA-binding transcriptional LysR family regulator